MKFLRIGMGVMMLLVLGLMYSHALFYHGDWSQKKTDYSTINDAYRDSWPGQPEYDKLKKERSYKQQLATRANTKFESTLKRYAGIVFLLGISFAAVTAAEIFRIRHEQKNDYLGRYAAIKKQEEEEAEKNWVH